MGIFNRKGTSRVEVAGPLVDSELAARVIDQLVASQAEGDTAARKAMRALSTASGLPATQVEIIMRITGEPDIYDRPWAFLSTAAAQAYDRADYLRAARACAFTVLFCRVIYPSMTLTDQEETGLGAMPPGAYRRALGTTGCLALAQLPPDALVAPELTVYALLPLAEKERAA